MARLRHLLKDKNFMCLWVGQILSQFGDRLGQMALIALVYKYAPGSVFELAKLFLFTVIPVFIIGPVAGVYVDRWDKRYTMIISDIVRGILVLLIPIFLLFTKTIFPAYLVVFLIFTITRFFLPSKMAIIPDLVSKEKLLIANSLISTTLMIATVIGIGLAGILVKIVGVMGGFYIDSVSFFVSAVMIAFIKLKKDSHNLKEELITTGRALEDAIKKSVIVEFWDGIKFLMKDRDARFVTWISFLLMGGIGAISVVGIVFVQETFHSVTTDLGILGMFLGIGLFFGAIFYGRFGQRLSKHKIIFLSFCLSGVVLTLFTASVQQYPSVSTASFICVILGMVSSPIVVSSNTLIHESLPSRIRGRVFSSLEVVIHLGFIIFMFLASAIAEHVSRAWILSISGLLFALTGLFGMVFYNKR